MERYYLPSIEDARFQRARPQASDLDLDHVYGALVSSVDGHRNVVDLEIGALAIGGYAVSPRIDRAMAPAGARGTVASVDGILVLVSASTTTPLSAGAEIAEGQEIRTGKGSRAVIRLRDGSRVEMAERSDLELSERWSGKTIHLERGSVMVEAAK